MISGHDFYLQALSLMKNNNIIQFENLISTPNLSFSFKESVVEQGNSDFYIGKESLFASILSLNDKNLSLHYFKTILDNNFNFFHNQYGVLLTEEYIFPLKLTKHWEYLVTHNLKSIFNESKNNKQKDSLFLNLLKNEKISIEEKINYLYILTCQSEFEELEPSIIFNQTLNISIQNGIKFFIPYFKIFKLLNKNRNLSDFFKNNANAFFHSFFYATKEDKDELINLFEEDLYLFKSNNKFNLISYIYSNYLTDLHMFNQITKQARNNDLLIEKRMLFLDYIIENDFLYNMMLIDQRALTDVPYYYHEGLTINMNHRPFEIKINLNFKDLYGDTILHYLLNKHQDKKNVLEFIEQIIKNKEIDIYNLKNKSGNSIYDLFPESKKLFWISLHEKTKINKQQCLKNEITEYKKKRI